MADTTFKQELDAAFADPVQNAAMRSTLGISRLYPLIMMPASGPMALTGGTSNYIPAGQVTLPGGTIKGGEHLRLTGMLSKLVAGTTGWSWRVRIGSVNLFSNFMEAPALGISFQDRLFISSDRKWGYSNSPNTMNENQFDRTDLLYAGWVSAAAKASMSARARATSVPFVTYDTAANQSAETVLVDFDQDQVLSVDIAGAADIVEMTGFALEIVPSSRQSFNPKRQNFYGNSITEGAGASSQLTNYLSRLRLLRPGTPVVGYGLGGQKSAAIVNRLVSDPSAKEARVCLAIGTNDFDNNVGNGPGWFDGPEMPTADDPPMRTHE